MTTYIPSRIDSVLRNLTDQAELWQKEAQYRQKMGVELYELGLKSNRSDLMEQGVNMIERRDTLARPFAKRFQFNYEGSGLDRGEIKDVPVNDVKAQMDGRFKPKTAQEAYAYMKSINEQKMRGDKTGTQTMQTDAMGYIDQLSKGVDFSEMKKNPKEWSTFVSTIANMTDDSSVSKMSEEDKVMMDAVTRRNLEAEERRMSPDSASGVAPNRMPSRYPHAKRGQDLLTKAYEAYAGVPLGKPYTPIDKSQTYVDRTQRTQGINNKAQMELDRMADWEKTMKEADKFSPESYKDAAKKDFIATKQSFDQLQKHRDTVKADAKRFVDETKVYNSRKEKVEDHNKEVMRRRAEIDEIDRMITSKDGQVRAEGYRRLHEYEVSKAGNSERAIVAADNRYQSNMSGLMLHYNDQIDPRVFATKRNFGGGGGGGNTFEYKVHLSDGSIKSIQVPKGFSGNVDDLAAKMLKVNPDEVMLTDRQSGINEKGKTDAEINRYTQNQTELNSILATEAKIKSHDKFGWSDKTDDLMDALKNEYASEIALKGIVPIIRDDGSFILVKGKKDRSGMITATDPITGIAYNQQGEPAYGNMNASVVDKPAPVADTGSGFKWDQKTTIVGSDGSTYLVLSDANENKRYKNLKTGKISAEKP